MPPRLPLYCSFLPADSSTSRPQCQNTGIQMLQMRRRGTQARTRVACLFSSPPHYFRAIYLRHCIDAQLPYILPLMFAICRAAILSFITFHFAARPFFTPPFFIEERAIIGILRHLSLQQRVTLADFPLTLRHIFCLISDAATAAALDLRCLR